MKDKDSRTFKTERFLMFTETMTKKEERLSSTEDIMVQIKDGLLPILIVRLHQRNQPLDTAKNGVCISTDYSTSDKECK
jgi:hypothetical protein